MQEGQKFVPKKEFWMFAVGGLGQGMIYAIMSSYVSDFYLSVLKLSPVFVLLLMLLARVWDAINDPIMGIVVDKTNTKHGKMRPYLLITPIPVAILTFLMFYAPDISYTSKMIYASFVYVLWGMIYTMSDVPYWSLPNVMTTNPEERASLISIGRTLNGIGSAIPLAIFMALGFILPLFGLKGSGLEKTRYMAIAIIASVAGNALFVTVFFTTKERVVLPPVVRDKSQPSALKLIFTCKPLMLVILMGVLATGRYLIQAGAIHVARYSFYIGQSLDGLDAAAREAAIQGSISLINTIFSITTAAGMFGTMLLMPLLFKKFTYKKIIIFSCLLGFASSMIMYFIGYKNFWFCVPFLVLSSVPLGVLNIVSYAMIGDCLDFMEWKTGRRENALGSACQSFVNKLSNAIATSFIVLMYIIVSLDVSKIGTEYTPDPTALGHSVRQGMFSLVSIVPAVCMLLCVIPILFYDLTGEKKALITRELAERRAAREANAAEPVAEA